MKQPLNEDRVFCTKSPDPLCERVGSGHKTRFKWTSMATIIIILVVCVCACIMEMGCSGGRD